MPPENYHIAPRQQETPIHCDGSIWYMFDRHDGHELFVYKLIDNGQFYIYCVDCNTVLLHCTH